jgi:hypothetical protein
MVLWKKRLLFIVFLVILSSITAYAGDTILINSKDWKDVYSGMLYGNMMGHFPQFLESVPHSTLILNGINKDANVSVFSSKKSPFVFGYKSTVMNQGYDNVEETVFDSLSLELAKTAEGINKFIIIDDSYGYNAIAVAPYAVLTNSSVLFADRTNIVEVEDFLEQKDPEKVLIYGHVDREVMNRLNKFNPEIINIDGDRFANNVEIVKKYLQVRNIGQVMLTNGEFIEQSLMTGDYPTLFIGRGNVPDKIKEFIQGSDIAAGVLVGNYLVGTATVVRRELGISVFVKFARSSREPTGAISQVEDLDLFAVPGVALNLNITNVRYNKLTKQIEITYHNFADVVTYFKGSYTLIDGDNEQPFGDIDPVFIAANSYKTIVYEVEPIISDTALLDVYTIFGESKNSLEFILDGVYPISSVEIRDDTDIDLKNAYYDKTKERFDLYFENIGQKEVYVDSEIIDIIILRERQTLSSEEIINIKKGRTKKAIVSVLLDDEDIENNPNIKVRAYFGERENAMIKVKEWDLELKIKEATWITYVPTVLIIILIILLILAMLKKKCQNCGQKNPRRRKTCKKCGVTLK